jgi:TusA-related sulfurtransferase
MSKKVLDLRGLSCPQPVLETKRAIETASFDTLEVIVDTKTSVENISRFVKAKGNIRMTIEEGEDYRISLEPLN